MLVKAVLIFLVAIVVIGWIGRLLLPGRGRRQPRLGSTTCVACGRPKIGPGPCACGRA